ncbi:hypothetical protein GCM10011609_87530 [Lentzea pudingi]|uniref:ABC-2 family transporter protein n=1 Tax=Lentzea pudingi TaxID=1789439 RepID=A0ABQ2IXA1_9PSEU|nr:hypothetical protein [Lentzea pudingi]GGN30020.1 hypothetical protein GCM10011609_87530 [Lentzea pudingi]
MNATTTDRPVVRTRVGWTDLLWLIRRQHRWMLVGTGTLVLVWISALLLLRIAAPARGPMGTWDSNPLVDLAKIMGATPMIFGLLIAVFWAAPLVSREYEQRTTTMVWSQDITSSRWLASKIVLLGSIAAGLAAALGASAGFMMRGINDARDRPAFLAFSEVGLFETAPHLQAAYAAFGFALGLAMSAITRRTVVAMAVTLAVYVGVRILVIAGWRPFYEDPVRQTTPIHGQLTNGDTIDQNPLYVAGGFLNSAGEPAELPIECLSKNSLSDDEINNCFADAGITHRFNDYQPADRLDSFQLVETAIFIVFTAILIGLAWMWIRRFGRT